MITAITQRTTDQTVLDQLVDYAQRAGLVVTVEYQQGGLFRPAAALITSSLSDRHSTKQHEMLAALAAGGGIVRVTRRQF